MPNAWSSRFHHSAATGTALALCHASARATLCNDGYADHCWCIVANGLLSPGLPRCFVCNHMIAAKLLSELLPIYPPDTSIHCSDSLKLGWEIWQYTRFLRLDEQVSNQVMIFVKVCQKPSLSCQLSDWKLRISVSFVDTIRSSRPTGHLDHLQPSIQVLPAQFFLYFWSIPHCHYCMHITDSAPRQAVISWQACILSALAEEPP